jgi:uncharacterized protein
MSGEPAASDRPLWRTIWDFPLVAMLVAVALVAATLAAISFTIGQLPGFPNQPAMGALQVVVTVALLFALYKLLLRRLGDRRHDDLPLAGAGRDLALGTLGAFVLMTLMVGIAAALGVYRILGWGGMANWVLVLFGGGVGAAFVEELIFRGILFRWIEEFGGSWLALAVTSALFGLAHIGNDGATWFSSVAIAIEAGLLLGGVYMLTRSLWAPIGLHFGWNVTQGLIWDVPVSGHDVDGLLEAKMSGDPLLSGGSFGLEASVIALVVATLAGVWLVRLAVQRGEAMQPWWVRRRAA